MQCTYPVCKCPFDMGQDEKCLLGHPNKEENVLSDKQLRQQFKDEVLSKKELMTFSLPMNSRLEDMFRAWKIGKGV